MRTPRAWFRDLLVAWRTQREVFRLSARWPPFPTPHHEPYLPELPPEREPIERPDFDEIFRRHAEKLLEEARENPDAVLDVPLSPELARIYLEEVERDREVRFMREPPTVPIDYPARFLHDGRPVGSDKGVDTTSGLPYVPREHGAQAGAQLMGVEMDLRGILRVAVPIAVGLREGEGEEAGARAMASIKTVLGHHVDGEEEGADKVSLADRAAALVGLTETILDSGMGGNSDAARNIREKLAVVKSVGLVGRDCVDAMDKEDGALSKGLAALDVLDAARDLPRVIGENPMANKLRAGLRALDVGAVEATEGRTIEDPAPDAEGESAADAPENADEVQGTGIDDPTATAADAGATETQDPEKGAEGEDPQPA